MRHLAFSKFTFLCVRHLSEKVRRRLRKSEMAMGQLTTWTAVAVISVLLGMTSAFQCPALQTQAFIPDPNDCRIYYHCLPGGRVFTMHCPNGLVFDSRQKICVWDSTARACAPDTVLETAKPWQPAESDIANNNDDSDNGNTAKKETNTEDQAGTARPRASKEQSSLRSKGRTDNSDHTRNQKYTTEKTSTTRKRPSPESVRKTTVRTAKMTTRRTAPTITPVRTPKMNSDTSESDSGLIWQQGQTEGASPDTEEQRMFLSQETAEPTGQVAPTRTIEYLANSNAYGTGNDDKIDSEFVTESVVEEAPSNIDWSWSHDVYKRSPQETNHITSYVPEDVRCPSGYAYVPDKSSCATFYHCYNWQPMKKVCPPGLFFDDQTLVCNWPQNVNCIEGYRAKTVYSFIEARGSRTLRPILPEEKNPTQRPKASVLKSLPQKKSATTQKTNTKTTKSRTTLSSITTQRTLPRKTTQSTTTLRKEPTKKSELPTSKYEEDYNVRFAEISPQNAFGSEDTHFVPESTTPEYFLFQRHNRRKNHNKDRRHLSADNSNSLDQSKRYLSADNSNHPNEDRRSLSSENLNNPLYNFNSMVEKRDDYGNSFRTENSGSVPSSMWHTADSFSWLVTSNLPNYRDDVKPELYSIQQARQGFENNTHDNLQTPENKMSSSTTQEVLPLAQNESSTVGLHLETSTTTVSVSASSLAGNITDNGSDKTIDLTSSLNINNNTETETLSTASLGINTILHLTTQNASNFNNSDTSIANATVNSNTNTLETTSSPLTPDITTNSPVLSTDHVIVTQPIALIAARLPLYALTNSQVDYTLAESKHESPVDARPSVPESHVQTTANEQEGQSISLSPFMRHSMAASAFGSPVAEELHSHDDVQIEKFMVKLLNDAMRSKHVALRDAVENEGTADVMQDQTAEKKLRYENDEEKTINEVGLIRSTSKSAPDILASSTSIPHTDMTSLSGTLSSNSSAADSAKDAIALVNHKDNKINEKHDVKFIIGKSSNEDDDNLVMVTLGDNLDDKSLLQMDGFQFLDQDLKAAADGKHQTEKSQGQLEFRENADISGDGEFAVDSKKLTEFSDILSQNDKFRQMDMANAKVEAQGTAGETNKDVTLDIVPKGGTNAITMTNETSRNEKESHTPASVFMDEAVNYQEAKRTLSSAYNITSNNDLDSTSTSTIPAQLDTNMIIINQTANVSSDYTQNVSIIVAKEREEGIAIGNNASLDETALISNDTTITTEPGHLKNIDELVAVYSANIKEISAHSNATVPSEERTLHNDNDTHTTTGEATTQSLATASSSFMFENTTQSENSKNTSMTSVNGTTLTQPIVSSAINESQGNTPETLKSEHTSLASLQLANDKLMELQTMSTMVSEIFTDLTASTTNKTTFGANNEDMATNKSVMLIADTAAKRNDVSDLAQIDTNSSNKGENISASNFSTANNTAVISSSIPNDTDAAPISNASNNTDVVIISINIQNNTDAALISRTLTVSDGVNITIRRITPDDISTKGENVTSVLQTVASTPSPQEDQPSFTTNSAPDDNSRKTSTPLTNVITMSNNTVAEPQNISSAEQSHTAYMYTDLNGNLPANEALDIKKDISNSNQDPKSPDIDVYANNNDSRDITPIYQSASNTSSLLSILNLTSSNSSLVPLAPVNEATPSGNEIRKLDIKPFNNLNITTRSESTVNFSDSTKIDVHHTLSVVSQSNGSDVIVVALDSTISPLPSSEENNTITTNYQNVTTTTSNSSSEVPQYLSPKSVSPRQIANDTFSNPSVSVDDDDKNDVNITGKSASNIASIEGKGHIPLPDGDKSNSVTNKKENNDTHENDASERSFVSLTDLITWYLKHWRNYSKMQQGHTTPLTASGE